MLLCHATHSLVYLDNFFEGQAGHLGRAKPKKKGHAAHLLLEPPPPRHDGPTMAYPLHYKQLGNYPNGLPNKPTKSRVEPKSCSPPGLNLDMPIVVHRAVGCHIWHNIIRGHVLKALHVNHFDTWSL